MQRRKFIKSSGLFAIGIGVFGNIRMHKNGFTGDTVTTTDILGRHFIGPVPPLEKISTRVKQRVCTR